MAYSKFRLGKLLLCTAMLAATVFAQATAPTQNPNAAPPKKINARPAAPPTKTTEPATEPFDTASVAQMASECVRMETEAGVIEIEMLAEAAPNTVRNFLNLAATGGFDTTYFHRIVKNFVVQGGNLATRGTMTPALAQRLRRTVPDEPNYVKHVRGIVSMARSDQPNSATTSFFILVGDAPHLDNKFAAFGRVRRGLEVADEMNSAPAEGEKPTKPVQLIRATTAPCAQAAANR
jgi:peptidyl-prolyl cis-trans isomerase B (cyclophilin B)